MIDHVLGAAVVRYTRKGDSAYPRSDENHAVEGIPPEQSGQVLARLDAVVAEMFAIEVDWEGLGFLDGIKYATSVIREAHPELDGDAISALRWLYGFEMR